MLIHTDDRLCDLRILYRYAISRLDKQCEPTFTTTSKPFASRLVSVAVPARTFTRPMASFVLVVVVGLLCVAAGHAQYEGDVCRLPIGEQGVCTTVPNCPVAREQINSGRYPKICSFANSVLIVCCDRVVSTPRTPTPTTRSPPARQPSPTTRSPPARQPSPTTRSPPARQPSPTTVTSKLPMTSRVDYNTKAGRKCREYARYVYWEEQEPTLLIIQETVNKSQCAMVVEELIVGGVEAYAKEFPHMAALGYGRKQDIQWKCGGVLISERFVVTAAHCLSAQGFGPVSWVRLGDLNLKRSDDNAQPVTMAVVERIQHEQYKPPAVYNDIALIKLERDVTFSPYIRPACLHTMPGNPPGLQRATATGWGKLQWSMEGVSDSLMKVDLELQAEAPCNVSYESYIKPYGTLKLGITPESMICAGDPKGEKDTCAGDSGGPLQIRLASPDPFCMYSVIGLTSYGGTTCEGSGQPAIYTRVSNYIPWIETRVWP